MSWTLEEPYVVILHGVRTVSPDTFEIDVEWSFPGQWGIPGASDRAWYVVSKREESILPGVTLLHAEFPYWLSIGQGVLVRVSGIVQRLLDEGAAVSFPIDIGHGEGDKFLSEEA